MFLHLTVQLFVRRVRKNVISRLIVLQVEASTLST